MFAARAVLHSGAGVFAEGDGGIVASEFNSLDDLLARVGCIMGSFDTELLFEDFAPFIPHLTKFNI